MLNATSSKPIHLKVCLLYFTLVEIDLFYFATKIQISESLYREVIFKHDL